MSPAAPTALPALQDEAIQLHATAADWRAAYDLDDLEAFQLNAAEAAFLPLEDREDLIERIVTGFADARAAVPAGRG